MNRRTRSLAFALGLAVLGSWSCHLPTESTPTYLISVADATPAVASFGTFDNQPAILGLHEILDGSELTASPHGYDLPVSSVRVYGFAFGASRGRHTLVLRVSAQTASPTMYRTSGIIVTLSEPDPNRFLSYRTVSSVTLPDQTRSLQTGDAITIDFDI